MQSAGLDRGQPDRDLGLTNAVTIGCDRSGELSGFMQHQVRRPFPAGLLENRKVGRGVQPREDLLIHRGRFAGTNPRPHLRDRVLGRIGQEQYLGPERDGLLLAARGTAMSTSSPRLLNACTNGTSGPKWPAPDEGLNKTRMASRYCGLPANIWVALSAVVRAGILGPWSGPKT